MAKLYFQKGGDMRNGVIAVLAGAGLAVSAATAFAAEPSEVGKVQAALDAWLAARAPIEKVTGIAAYISFGATGPAIEAFAGKVGRDLDSGPVDQDTLYQMGSTSKSFTVAVILPHRLLLPRLGHPLGFGIVGNAAPSPSAACST